MSLTPADARDLAVIGLVGLAPVTIVLLAVIMRGYSIHLHMHRERRDRHD